MRLIFSASLKRGIPGLPRLLLVSLLTLSLSACASLLTNTNTSLGEKIGTINEMPIGKARSFIADRTIMTYDPGTGHCVWTGTRSSCFFSPGHGTQIEYFDDRGLSFLWYPGNRRPVPARWEIRRNSAGSRYEICFQYPSNSYNPLTHTRGGKLQCRDLGTYATRVSEFRDSDIFRLATGRVPHPLEKDETTFDELLAKIRNP